MSLLFFFPGIFIAFLFVGVCGASAPSQHAGIFKTEAFKKNLRHLFEAFKFYLGQSKGRLGIERGANQMKLKPHFVEFWGGVD